MTHRVLNKLKQGPCYIHSEVMKTIQCVHPPHHYSSDEEDGPIGLSSRLHSIRIMLLALASWALCVIINILALLAWCLVSTLLVLTLTMRELCHWSSIVGMSPQSHCGDEEMGAFWIIFMTSLYKYIYILCRLLWINPGARVNFHG